LYGVLDRCLVEHTCIARYDPIAGIAAQVWITRYRQRVGDWRFFPTSSDCSSVAELIQCGLRTKGNRSTRNREESIGLLFGRLAA
jgi:hypothetical protein